MSKYDELKRLAEAGLPACCGEKIPTGVEHGGDREMMCCEKWQQGEASVPAFDLLELIAENERLAATNEQITAALYDQIEITHQHRLESDGLKAERDQMRELLMRLVDLQNSGRGPIRSYELWNDLVNEARPLLGLEVRHV